MTYEKKIPAEAKGPWGGTLGSTCPLAVWSSQQRALAGPCAEGVWIWQSSFFS